MTGFARRFGPAQAWESQLLDHLRNRGWLAEPFGQAQIPEPMRPHLHRWADEYGRPTLLRWTPDIIAVRPTARPFVCLIDAKTETEKHKNGDNFSVEINAVEAGLAIVRDWSTPLFYVWPDGRYLTPQTVLNRWNRKLDGADAGGSKTAFYLVAKKWADSATALFEDCNGRAQETA